MPPSDASSFGGGREAGGEEGEGEGVEQEAAKEKDKLAAGPEKGKRHCPFPPPPTSARPANGPFTSPTNTMTQTRTTAVEKHKAEAGRLRRASREREAAIADKMDLSQHTGVAQLPPAGRLADSALPSAPKGSCTERLLAVAAATATTTTTTTTAAVATPAAPAASASSRTWRGPTARPSHPPVRAGGRDGTACPRLREPPAPRPQAGAGSWDGGDGTAQPCHSASVAEPYVDMVVARRHTPSTPPAAAPAPYPRGQRAIPPAPLTAVGPGRSPKTKQWQDMFEYLQAVVPDYIEVSWTPGAAHSLCVRDTRLAVGQDSIVVRFSAAQGGQVTHVSVVQTTPELRNTVAVTAAVSSSSSSGNDGDGSTSSSREQRAHRPTRPRATHAAPAPATQASRRNWWSKLELLRGLVQVPLHEFPDMLVEVVAEKVE